MQPISLTPEETAQLRDTFLFRDLPARCLLRVLTDERCDRAQFSRGAVIYSPTRFRRSLGVLLAGTVTVTKGALVVSTLEVGALFGAAALFHERPEYETTLTARTNCDAVFFPQSLVEDLLEEFPKLAGNYIRYLSQRIHFLNEKIQGLTAPGTRQKLAHYLLMQPDASETVACTATELAQRLDVGRASLYRAFQALEDSGAIVRRGKSLWIANRNILQTQSE